MNTLLLIAVLPLLMAVLGLIPRAARWLPLLAAGLMLLQIPVAAWVCLPALASRAVAEGAFAVDGVGGAFVLITTLVAAAAMLHAALLLPAERVGEHAVTDRRFCLFYTLSGLFLLAMYGVLLAQNLGILWMAMEATTLMSAPLVYYHRSRRSLEATWKYLLLCSVGIAFALFGTVILFAAQHAGGEGGTLVLGELMARAQGLDPRLLRLGFVFCLLGYGTKAGLFPLHNWLPDAHSEAPAPSSAMLSGALLNCALVAIWRVSQVVIAAGQGELVRHLLVPAGAVTVLAASLILVRQHDLKRMWAYSSMEHVGLLTLAIGIGSGPVFILHALNHSLVKVALFVLAGGIMYCYGTKTLNKLGGLLEAAPLWGILLAAASFAIAGSPPFGTFLSEWMLLRDTFAAGEVLAAIVVLIGLTITFVAVASHVGRVVLGHAPTSFRRAPVGTWAVVPASLMALSLAAGLALAPPVMTTLARLSTPSPALCVSAATGTAPGEHSGGPEMGVRARTQRPVLAFRSTSRGSAPPAPPSWGGSGGADPLTKLRTHALARREKPRRFRPVARQAGGGGLTLPTATPLQGGGR